MLSSIIDNLIFVFATSTTLHKIGLAKWIGTLLILGRFLYWLVTLTKSYYKRKELIKQGIIIPYIIMLCWLIYLCIYDTDGWLIYPCIFTIISLIVIVYFAFKSEKIPVKFKQEPQRKKPKKPKSEKIKFEKSKNSLNLKNVKFKQQKGSGDEAK